MDSSAGKLYRDNGRLCGLEVTCALSSDGNTLYLGKRNDGNIHPFDTATLTEGSPIATGATAFNCLAVAPDRTLYAGDRNSGNIYPR